MLKNITIENFKSIYQDSIELGRVNVFIGENGSGKSNILEALGMVSAAASKRLDNDGLALKGLRIAKPSITFSSFLGKSQKKIIGIETYFNVTSIYQPVRIITNLSTKSNDDFETWKTFIGLEGFPKQLNNYLERNISETRKNEIKVKLYGLKNKVEEQIQTYGSNQKIDELYQNFKEYLSEEEKYVLRTFVEEEYLKFIKPFKIYNLNTPYLRGLQSYSKEIPGIYGENLDLLIASLDGDEYATLAEYYNLISWLEDIELDSDNKRRLEGFKLSSSTSRLYFKDKFMQRKNNVFSVENANEGVLYILFYLATIISKRTPKFFAIDNIEKALNPWICRNLMKTMVLLAKKYDKQILITTHNPAVLDGLNIHDEEQKLYTVYRNREGHTRTKEVKLKPNATIGGMKLKLSEHWMRNNIKHGLPQINF